MLSTKADNVLSSVKLYADAIDAEKNKSFVDRLNKIRPSRALRDTNNYIFKLNVSMINSNKLLTI